VNYVEDVSVTGALRTAQAWLARWAVHVGGCRGGNLCTCGLTRAQWEAEAALDQD